MGTHPQDDLKPASGEIYVACKKILGLTRAGKNVKEFAREILAPLIKPGMAVYEELKSDIFGLCSPYPSQTESR